MISHHPPESARHAITCDGTLIYFDTTSHQLRHAPIGTSPSNICVTPQKETIVLYWQDNDTTTPIGDFGPNGCKIGTHAVRLTAIPTRPGLFTLTANGRYLEADPDGAIRMSQEKRPDRQSFLLLTQNELHRLTFILANRWLSPVPGRNAGTFSCVPPHSVEIAGLRCPIHDILNETDPLPKDLYLPFDGWKLERFTLYRPLAYLAAYGNNEMFRCADIAIRALFAFGEFDGDILLIAATPDPPFLHALPEPIRNRIHIEVIQAHDVLDYTIARYRIADFPMAEAYQPVLYLDTDVICDAPVQPLLHALTFSPQLHAYPEMPLGHELDFYGKSLLEADGITIAPGERGLSSGIFAFRNIAEQRHLFHMIIDTAYRFTALLGRRDLHVCYDQVFFNYVGTKTKSITGTLLNDIVIVHFSHFPLIEQPHRKGFVHFAGGVGNTTPKLTHMQTYCRLLAIPKVAFPPGP